MPRLWGCRAECGREAGCCGESSYETAAAVASVEISSTLAVASAARGCRCHGQCRGKLLSRPTHQNNIFLLYTVHVTVSSTVYISIGHTIFSIVEMFLEYTKSSVFDLCSICRSTNTIMKNSLKGKTAFKRRGSWWIPPTKADSLREASTKRKQGDWSSGCNIFILLQQCMSHFPCKLAFKYY